MAGVATVRVLLVEDDQDDRGLVADLLGDAKRARFIIDDAPDGQTAQKQIKKNRYDVILLDYRLPDMTGLNMMEWLSTNHFRVPVVLVTSHGDTRLQADAIEAGFCEYLEKGTFNAEVLERTLLYAIGLHDKQTRNGDSGGFGLLIQELVGLTRESVTAQTKTAHEMTELRADRKTDREALQTSLDGMKVDLLKEIKKGPWDKFKEMLAWVVAHPWAAVIILLFLALFVTLLVLLIGVLDMDKLKQLRGAAAMLPPALFWGTA